MPVVHTRVEERLERWSGTAFLLAGGLFFVSPMAKGLVILTDTSPQVWLVALLVFSGLSVSLVGLLGFYPRLADQTPRLSLAGAVATVIAGAVTLVVFAWMMGIHLLPEFTQVSGLATPPVSVFLALILSLGTAFTLFGIASLWSGVPSRSAGRFLLALASPWILLLVGHSVFSSLPVWLSIALYGLIPMVMLLLGHHLRTVALSTGPETPSNEPIMT